MLIALALYISYQTVTNLLNFVTADLPTSVSDAVGQFLAQGLFLAGTLVVAGFLAHLVIRPADRGSRDTTVLAAFVVPALVALATETIEAIPPQARPGGLWRLLMVGILVHAIARYRLFDLDLKLKSWAAPGLAACVFAFGALVALVRFANDGRIQATLTPVILAGFAAGSVVIQRDRVGRILFPGALEDPAYVEQRKLEVYQAALEGVIADEVDPDEDPVLADLRRKLDISEEAHASLVAHMGSPGSEGNGGLGPIESGALVSERYRVDRVIGEGAHGRAFLAWDMAEEREIVLKVVGKPVIGGEAVERLLREAELMADIDDPHVLDVHEVLEGRHELVLVTEYANGGTLAEMIAKRGALGLTDAVSIVDQVLQALEAAHAEGVVHRDIKPENILLADGEVRVADFGVAKRTGDDTALTAGPVGTLLYMSPERIRGDDVDERSDLYAIGVVLHRALTSGFYLPTSGADDFAIRRMILEDPPTLGLGDQPQALRELLERALAKDPDDRFASAHEMRDALATVQALRPRPTQS
jgi:hypothetical protein